jgi:hypothetical protein
VGEAGPGSCLGYRQQKRGKKENEERYVKRDNYNHYNYKYEITFIDG